MTLFIGFFNKKKTTQVYIKLFHKKKASADHIDGQVSGWVFITLH